MKIRVNTFWPAIFGLIFATLLFCLPGEKIPTTGWLEKMQVDKIVHVCLFTALVNLWCLPMNSRVKSRQQRERIYTWITSAFVVYGIAIEFIQLNYIPYRSFDLFDIVADAVGCVTGWVTVRKLS